MKTHLLVMWIVLVALGVPAARAQTPTGFRDTFMGAFDYAADRIVALAEAMPADHYAWHPDDEAMTVERVYMHIAHYNYLYPHENLGIDVPDGIDIETMEQITGKEAVVDQLKRSVDYVRTVVGGMTEEDLAHPAKLYGRDTYAWGVLHQLQVHMAEHLGQSIAYARMNGVAPPWSQ
jgi:uncharacterized damage-inducible protein DinB